MSFKVEDGQACYCDSPLFILPYVCVFYFKPPLNFESELFEALVQSYDMGGRGKTKAMATNRSKLVM